MIEINAETLNFALNYGVKSFPTKLAGNVSIERADYDEIDEINHQLSEELARMRQEDAEAMLHARDFISD